MTKTSQYASVLAKIGFERGNLLEESKLRALSESKNLEEFTSRLHETTYSEYLSEEKDQFNSREIEHAIKENLLDSFTKIVNYSPKKVGKFLENLIRNYEVENIKTLIKTVSAGLTTEEKLNRIHLSAEEFFKNRPIFEEAATENSIKETVEILKDIDDYSLALDSALNRYQDKASTKIFDIFLDKTYYKKLKESYTQLPKNEQKHALYYVRMKAEGFILITILRAKTLQYEPNWLRLAIPSVNFRINQKTVEALVVSEDFDIALKMIQHTFYGNFFKTGLEAEEIISNSEKSLQMAIFDHACKTRLKEIFNVEAPLSFMMQKEIEAKNLSAISLGIENMMKPEDIQSKLSFSQAL